MFLKVECEVNTREVMEKMLENHSPHYILYLLAECYNYHSPEYFADKLAKILDDCDE